MAGARRIVQHPACDQGTAQLLYWRLAPHALRRHPDAASAPARLRAAVALAWELEARLLAGDFATCLFRFDPTNDAGVDRTQASEEEARAAARPMPAELCAPCGPSPGAGESAALAAEALLERGCRTGDVRDVDAALRDGAWAGLSPARKRELLGMAVERDHGGVVERLVAAGASVRGARDHRTLLDDAPSVPLVDLLVRLGADAREATLALAVARGAEVVRRLVALGTPLGGLSRWGEPALYRAAVDGRLEVVVALVELGADVHQPRQQDGRTALQAVDERIAQLQGALQGNAPYDSPARTELGVFTSVRNALVTDRKVEDARYW
ncbi:MAG: hypothetical protein RL653_2203 [Pseudomonadota bacterium]